MVDFYPVKTEDGTLSLFNTKINDIYHSKVGAYTEALNKFVIPSGIINYARNNDTIRILDICYGLGYNTRVAVNEIWKVNPKCKIHVTGIEIDPNVLACSYLVKFINEDKSSKQFFKKAILSNPLTRKALSLLSKDVNFTTRNTLNIRPYKRRSKNPGTKYNVTTPQRDSLHNIYYRSISDRYSNKGIIHYNSDFLDICLHINDVKRVIPALKQPYSFIFHDPFTPSIVPSLWSVEIFKLLYSLLGSSGNVTTYSSSAAVRSGMIEAGFHIGKTDPVGRKSSGTIAYKDSHLITTPLNSKDCGLLETNAGIPYYDKDFKYTNEQIIKNRNIMLINSERISTSKYLKI
jgi:tRNA U34 5-methylaminomethyl-2-thiouridine-forming methyltransferase MnmC